MANNIRIKMFRLYNVYGVLHTVDLENKSSSYVSYIEWSSSGHMYILRILTL